MVLNNVIYYFSDTRSPRCGIEFCATQLNILTIRIISTVVSDNTIGTTE